MGEHAEYQLAYEMARGFRFKPAPVPHWPKVECPACGKLCGGRGDHQDDGVHQHMKFKHGIKKKWKRVEMLRSPHTGD